MGPLDTHVGGMAAVRVLGAIIEIIAAALMVRYNRVDVALKINAILGLAGPLVLIAVTVLGVVGLSGRVAPYKLTLIFIGVYLMLLGSNPD